MKLHVFPFINALLTSCGCSVKARDTPENIQSTALRITMHLARGVACVAVGLSC